VCVEIVDEEEDGTVVIDPPALVAAVTVGDDLLFTEFCSRCG
jgi:hypothetical protein